MKFLGRRFSRVVLPVFGAALAAGALGAPAQADDLPEFSFADCPAIPDGHQAMGSLCLNAVVVSGRLQFGNIDQEITEPIRLTWGSFRNATNPFTPPKIVFGSFQAGQTEVQPGIFAQPEFAGVFNQPASANFEITLGIKIRLINPALGPDCSIAGDDDPIVLNLTTGTTNPPPPNEPITGTPATIVQTDPIVVRSATHVDNAFAVPGARNCGIPPGSLDAVVNATAGTPSPAGTNTTVQNDFIGQKSYTELS